jgi:sugar lactone lactonase YvrE
VAVDGAGTVYVTDAGTDRIRKVSPDGTVTTIAGSSPGFADGRGTAARFNDPEGLAVDPAGNLYVADAGNHRIRKITPDGTVTTIAGIGLGYADGLGTQARFKTPQGLAYAPDGRLIVADQENNRIRAIDLSSPGFPVVTLDGTSINTSLDGDTTSASFRAPTGVAVDGQGRIYVTEPYTHRIRMIR